MAPSHGHGFKLCVNIIRRHQQRIFHNIRRDLAFSGQGSDFADGFTQIICNGLNDGLGVLKDAVQFLATKDTGSHCLCKLKGCGFNLLCTGSDIHKRLVQGFREGNQFIIVGEGITGHQAHLGNGLGCGQVRSPRPLGGSHDLLFQFGHGTAIIHDQVQPGLGAGKIVRQINQLLHRSQSAHRNGNFLDLAQHTTSGGTAFLNGVIELALGLVCLSDILFHLVKTNGSFCQIFPDLLKNRRIKAIPEGIFDGIHCVDQGVHTPAHSLQGASNAIIQGKRCSDCCHYAAPPFLIFLRSNSAIRQ